MKLCLWIHVCISGVALSFFGCASSQESPIPIPIVCQVSAEDMFRQLSDTLVGYGFFPISSKQNEGILESARQIEDGVSVRTIYCTVRVDSTVPGMIVFIKTHIQFRSSEEIVFYDESVKRLADFRSDFVPLLNALRDMCGQSIPRPDYLPKERRRPAWKRE